MRASCRKHEETIQRYLDGDLLPDEIVALRRHIGECASCRGELESYSLLFSGLENMLLDEPSADFNAAVLSRIPFPDREVVPVKRGWLGFRPGMRVVWSMALFSVLGLFLLIAGSGKISLTLSSGLLKALGSLEWLSMSSAHGLITIVTFLANWPVLRSLILLGRILLNTTLTTVSDPYFALVLSTVMTISVISTVVMAKVLRRSWKMISVNGAEISRVLPF